MFMYDNLRFRKLEKSELDLLTTLKKESWAGTHNISYINEDDQLKWFESLDSDPISPTKMVMIVDILPEKIPIGIFKINDIQWVNQTANVGWDVFKNYRNKGFGKKLVAAGAAFCFAQLHLRRLSAEILDSNKASQKCALDAGFRLEGTIRQAVARHNGVSDVYIDSHLFGLLKKEFVFMPQCVE